MYQFASISLIAYGFFYGTYDLVHSVTGYLSSPELPFSLGLAISETAYIFFILAGILAIKHNRYAKYIALYATLAWLCSHFIQLTWPLNKPGFFGDSGWETWKRTLDIIGVGIIHGGALCFFTYTLFKFNKPLKSQASPAETL